MASDRKATYLLLLLPLLLMHLMQGYTADIDLSLMARLLIKKHISLFHMQWPSSIYCLKGYWYPHSKPCGVTEQCAGK